MIQVTIQIPMGHFLWWSIVSKSLSPAVFEIFGPKYIEVTTLTILGHVTSSVTWKIFDSQVVISYRCSIGTKSVSPTIVEIMGPKYLGSWSWPFWVTWRHQSRHDSTWPVTWPFESQWVISDWWSIGPKSLSPSVFEIFGVKHIGVTTLTFLGHVTSSVTWPFESQSAVSYWSSTGSKSQFPAVFEIFGPKYIEVTTLTFLGHVTSSVAWPFDS